MAGERVSLIGFMGSGKTTVGQRLAAVLETGYYDTDDWMTNEMGIDVPAAVAENPEQFRRAEAKAYEDILGQEPGVIATGGGIVTTELGRNVLKASGVPTVWMLVPFEVSEERVMKDVEKVRPLFKDRDSAMRLHEERMPLYRAVADHVVMANGSVESTVDRIITVLHRQELIPKN